MTQFKYNTGDQVRVLKASKPTWWYACRIGEVFTLADQRALGDGPNYTTTQGDGLLFEADIELVGTAASTKTLAQVVAEVNALKAQRAAANTTLASIAEHYEKLRVELESFGLALMESGVVEAPVVIQTMKELYHQDAIVAGDVFTFIGPVDRDRMWVVGRNYRIDSVDSDNSVLTQCLIDEDDYSWAWQNEGAFDKFVKA